MDQLLGAVLVFISTLTGQRILGVATQDLEPFVQEVLEISQPIKTESRFEEKLSTQSATISKKTVYKDDPETEAGIDTVLDEGANGKKIITYKITYYHANTSDGGTERSRSDSSEVKQKKEEYSRELVSIQTIDPQDKIISRGTKIVWHTLDTPEGPIQYWKKMRVYATHYDSRCPGCNEWTAIGMRAGKGVIAVDPAVIKMKSKVYIPGYGQAIAGDTGGAIKGNIIDLGFDDARTAGWTAHFIDIYLL
ncbi:G5 domain-containing protein [Candidatus Daviesbacteria bacterium]|nr:G5 domain-containing protein [Candidatus Daviesbacteria bacterium]